MAEQEDQEITSQELTAFITKYRLYESCVMPFGFCNAPAACERLVKKILKKCQGFCESYIDDIFIYSATSEEHVQHVRTVLQILLDNHLFVKLSKCNFFTQESDFIGIVITPEGCSMQKKKVDAIQSWGPPLNLRTYANG